MLSRSIIPEALEDVLLMSNVTATRRHLLAVTLRPQHCQYAVSSKDRNPPADAVLRPQPTLRTDEGLLRARERGNRGLPLSPLLDFAESGHERNHAEHKPEPEPESMSEFQKELANSPFGRSRSTWTYDYWTDRVQQLVP